MAALIAVQQDALASCTVHANANTVVCDTTTTTNTTNTDAFSPTSNDQVQRFDAFGAVTGTVNAGVTVDGFGLSIQNQQAGANANIDFTNFGTVAATNPSAANALELITSGTVAGGTTVTATNNGILTGNSGNNGAGLLLSGGGSFTVTNGGTIGGTTGISALNLGAFDITTSGGSVSGSGHAIDASLLNGSGGTGTVSVTGGTVSSSTTDAIVLSGGTSNVTASVSGGSVTTTAAAAKSVSVVTTDGAAAVNISGGSVNAGGNTGNGAIAASFGTGDANATMSAGAIAATGPAASGLSANALGSGNATVQMTGGTVTASGDSSVGVSAIANSGFATADIGIAASINATGPNSTGLFLQGNFVQGVLLGTLSATGTNSFAAQVNSRGSLNIGDGVAFGTLIGNVALNDTGAQLVFNRPDAITYDGAISGSGGVVIGTGTVNLTGASTYTNATEIDSGATLALKGNGSIASSSFLTFTSCGCGGPATFDISQTNTGASVNGLFDPFGTASVKLGAKILTLIGNVGPFNGVIADGGVGGGTGGSIVVQAGAVATFGGTSTYTGATTINNGGELDLTGTASIAGSSEVISNGIFDISGLSNGGTSIKSLAGTGSVALGGNNLTLTNANDDFGGSINGAGGLILNGGTQALSGVNAYTGGTTVNGGTLQIGNNSALGSGALSMAAGTTLSFASTGNFSVANNIQISGDPFFAPPANTTQTLSGVISDGGSPGTLDMIGPGTLVLTGANTYTGGTTISAGTLQLGSGGFSGSIVGNVTDNGTLVFNRALPTLFDGTISGTGAVQQNGFGATTLTATNSYTGLTTINTATSLGLAGTGSIAFSSEVIDNGTFNIAGLTTGSTSIKSLSGSGFVALGNNNLTLSNASGVFSGQINGTGGLILSGGTETLSGTNFYSGGTTIAGGTLQLGNGGTGGSIVGNVTDNGTLAFNRADIVTFDGTIAGTGGVQQNGTGTTILTASNTYTGGTTVAAGTLQLGTASTAGNVVGAIDVNANATLNLVNTAFSGVTSLVNGGFVDVTNASTTGSAQITNRNGVEFEGASSAGTATITNAGLNALLRFFNTSSAGGASIGNTGFVQFSDNSTAGTASITNDQSVAFFNSSIAGNAAITNNSDGSLQFQNTSSAGNATITNTGFANFIDSSTAANATITNNANGFVSFFASSTAGAATIANNGDLLFNDSSSAGAASIVNNSNVQFSSNATAGSASIVTSNGGTVLFFDNSTGGTAQFTTNAGGVVDFSGTLGPNNDGNVSVGSIAGGGDYYLGANRLTVGGNNLITTVSGVISDCGPTGQECDSPPATTGGSLVKTGSGTLTLTGTNTYTGGTTISAGTLQLGNGGVTGSIVGDVTDNATLAFNRSDAVTFGGAISGNGTVRQAGGGVLTLSGTSTYTGPTFVDAGMLFVSGALNGTSSVTVGNGAILAGTGTVGSTSVQSGGILLPGGLGTPGTLTVNGNLTFAPDANYVVFVTPSSTSKTSATGTAPVGGVVFANFLPATRYRPGEYTILTAAGVSGTFATLDTLGLDSSSGVRNPHLAYDASDVFLVLDPTTITIAPGFSGNQQNVANGINGAILGGANPNDSFNTLLGFTGTQLTNALTQLAGATPGGANTAAMQLMNGFLSLLQHPSGGPPQGGGSAGPTGSAGASGYAAEAGFPREVAEAYAAVMPVKAPPGPQTAFASRWSTWAAGYGGTTQVGGQADAGTADTNARAFAVAGGAEYKLSADTVLGFALAGGGTSWSLGQGLGSGGGDAFQIGGYATHKFGAAYVSGALAYGWHDMHTDRTVTAVGAEQLHAGFRAQSFGARLEGGYRLATRYLGITPYGALQVQTFHTPSYSEAAQSGPGAFALSYNSRDVTATRTELGAWFDKPFALAPDRLLMLRGRLAWAHDHATDPTLGAVFQTLPGSNFTVNTTAAPRDLALVGAGAELKLAGNWSIAAKFDGEFSDRSQSYAGTGVIKRVW